MTITELIPQLHNLSNSEKLTVIKFLVQELESKSEDLTPNESVFGVASLRDDLQLFSI